jgi:hypothetical protein
VGCFGLGDALQVWTLRRATSGGLTCPKSGLFVVTQQMGAKSAKSDIQNVVGRLDQRCPDET